MCYLQEIIALKAQVKELRLAVDAIKHHLSLPTAALPAAIAAKPVEHPAQKGGAATAASARQELPLPLRSSGGIAEVTFLCSCLL